MDVRASAEESTNWGRFYFSGAMRPENRTVPNFSQAGSSAGGGTNWMRGVSSRSMTVLGRTCSGGRSSCWRSSPTPQLSSASSGPSAISATEPGLPPKVGRRRPRSHPSAAFRPRPDSGGSRSAGDREIPGRPLRALGGRRDLPPAALPACGVPAPCVCMGPHPGVTRRWPARADGQQVAARAAHQVYLRVTTS